MFGKLDESIRKAIKSISKAGFIRIITHYDCDGISAGAIALKALQRARKQLWLSIVDKIDSKLAESLKEQEADLYLFCDCGAGYLDLLYDCKPSVILDHHKPEGKIPARAVHINPHKIGLNEDEISGAGLAFLTFWKLAEQNKDLLPLAILGAIGDLQDSKGPAKWKLQGANRKLLEEAKRDGYASVRKGLRLFGRSSRPLYKALQYADPYIPEISGSESSAIQFLADIGIDLKKDGKWRTLDDLSTKEKKKLATAIVCERIRGQEAEPEQIFGEQYSLCGPFGERPARELAAQLNACGKLEKAEEGLLALLGNRKALEKLPKLLDRSRKRLGSYLAWVRENPRAVKKSTKAVYLRTGSAIHPNFIGTVATILKDRWPQKAIIGLAINGKEVKVSARAENVNLHKLLHKAALKVGGDGGGHKDAAGATIPLGSEERFIEECENWLKAN